MKKILIVASNYMDLKISSNNRTNFLPQFLHEHGYCVEVVTSDFNHHRKEHIKEVEKRDYKITLLHEIGYKTNVSLKRFLSIYFYKRNLKKYLKNRDRVDIVYSFVPPHSIAQVAEKFARRVNAKFIIDVRDLWPEAFSIVIPNKRISSLLFYPLKLYANRTYKLADEIVAVSDTYKRRAVSVNKKNIIGHTIYLGTSLKEFDQYAQENIEYTKPTNEVWVVYAGTLGNSYDLTTVFRAFEIIKNKGLENIKLQILGSGPLEDRFKELAGKLKINVNFYERLPYQKMVAFLVRCDIVLNPLVKGASQSIINKHADYAASGLPVISTQITKEYVDLINSRKMGCNVNVGDYTEMAEKIMFLSDNEVLRLEMGRNHRKFAEEKLNRDIIYQKLLDIL